MSDSESKQVDVLLSAFTEALHGRRIKLIDRELKGEPLNAYGQAHRRTHRQLELAIQAIDRMENTRSLESWGTSLTSDPIHASDAFLDLVYRATELFDFYAQDIPFYLGIDKTGSHISDGYRSEIKRRRDPWALLCNRCKHNHRFLVPVEGRYADNDRVTGFSLYGRVGDRLAIDKSFHRTYEITSYNWILRKLLADIFISDNAAALLVNQLIDEPTHQPISSITYALPYILSLKKIEARSIVSFPREPKGPNISFGEGTIDISDTHIEKENRSCKIRMWIEILGYELKFQGQYDLGSIDIAINEQNSKSTLPGIFLRAAIDNLELSP